MHRGALDPENPLRIRYLLTNLTPGATYEMRVHLYDITSGDTSLWSNIYLFITEPDATHNWVDRETEEWLNYMRRRLAEILRRPYWIADNTPENLTLVYRPADVFAGLIAAAPGSVITLHNNDVNRITYYLPTSAVRDANAARMGFLSRYSDMDIMFAPSFLNPDHNQPMLDMARQVNNVMSDVTDSFVRVTVNRTPTPGGVIDGVPTITPETNIMTQIVGTNRNIRNLNTWDASMYNRASQIINRRVEDPVLRESIRQMLLDGWESEQISTHIYSVIDSIEAEVTRAVAGDMRNFASGILSPVQQDFAQFDAAVHLIATSTGDNAFVTGYERITGRWMPQSMIEHHNGPAMVARAPGVFSFTGRNVNIPGIVDEEHGTVITRLVARYGLEDFLGLNLDLHQNATCNMLAGSVARMAGAPRGANPIEWVDANLNINMSSRNANQLMSQQESIAMIMALYEHRTNTRIDNLMIRNFVHTANMNLDSRYAQAVRAAFELELVTDYDLNPAGPITIGEFLNMLAILDARVPL